MIGHFDQSFPIETSNQKIKSIMEKLNKGDFIVIKFEKKLAHAKVVAHVPEKGRINVFTQGTLKWIDDSAFVRMGEKGASLKAGEFVKPKKESSDDIKKEIAELGKSGTTHSVVMDDKVIPLSGETVRIEKESSVASIADQPSVNIELTETDEMYLAPFRKGKTGKSLTVEQVSDMVGKSTPATAHALHRLCGLGYLELLNSELKEYALSIRGLKHNTGTAKKTADVPKLKTDKKSGEVALSKKDRVLALLKNPDLSVKQIAEMTGAAQSYIRGIRERTAKKMDVPEEGSIKRKVYDALRAGGTLVDVAKRCKVTISYAYQIRQQMLSAKII
jgi:hypothetical protein